MMKIIYNKKKKILFKLILHEKIANNIMTLILCNIISNLPESYL